MGQRLLLILLLLVIFGSLPLSASEENKIIALQPIQRDTPFFKRSQDRQYGQKYSIKMIKLKDQPQIKAPPQTQAVVLYFGQIKLGQPALDYGVLIDFEGKEKFFWVDSNADGDYSQEPAYQIFKSDRFPLLNVYYSPTPLSFKVTYTRNGESYPMLLQMEMPYLVLSRLGYYDELYFFSRTWLNGIVADNGEELQLALVDTDDNGNFNDPDDLIFIDNDYDLNFTAKEGKPIKKAQTIKLKSGRKYLVDYSLCPEKLILRPEVP